MLKILGGTLKGFYIRTSHRISYRPITSTLRKAFFDYLNDFIKYKIFVDAFAGTGIVGFEALSRGASFITFIDSNKEAISLINKNIKALNITSSLILPYKIEFVISKNMLPSAIDIIFLDPPYRYPKSKLENLLNRILNSNILNKNALLAVRYEKYTGKLNYNTKSLELIKEFTISEAYLDIYKGSSLAI